MSRAERPPRLTLRLYEDDDRRARVEGAPGFEVDLWGWRGTPGVVFDVRHEGADLGRYRVVVVHAPIKADDPRGPYLLGEAVAL